MTERLERALSLAAAGYRTFPVHGINDRGECTCGKKTCGSKGKHPAISGWQNKATTDQEQIRKWWERNPNYNPAIVTGDGLLVLDVDGETGKNSLKELIKSYGPLPPTRSVFTGGGGIHYYFKVSQKIHNSVSSLAPGLDIRADGGLVVAPGAKHHSGKLYDWELLCSPDDIEEAEAPEWLLDLLKAPEQKKDKPTYTPGDKIPEHERNNTLYSYGRSLRGKQGKTMEEIKDILHTLNIKECIPPLEQDEVDTIIRSIDKLPRGGPMFQPAGIVWASEVKAEEARFVINPYIPEGQLTMIQGNPGDGKTAFACKLAALVSTGGDLLGYPTAIGKVLIMSVEDDKPVLRGRIEASGGDLTQCAFVENDAGLTFSSPEIEQYVMETQAKLVIFDPVQAFLGADVDMHRANETRPILAALKEMAQRNNCAVVIISHLNKGLKDDAAILRSLGSIDIPGACRSVLHIGRLAGDPEKRLMVQVKSSAAKEGQSIIFSIGAHGMVDLETFTNKGYEDLSSIGKKVRQAAEDPFLTNAVIESCKKLLNEHPEGVKVTYDDMGITWPDGIKQKKILDALAGKLAEVGITVKAGERTSGKGAAQIMPLREI